MGIKRVLSCHPIKLLDGWSSLDFVPNKNTLKKENSNRHACYLKYFELLNDNKNLTLPVVADLCSSVHHIFPIRLKKRNELQEFLRLNNIGTMIHYPIPPHLQNAYKYLGFKIGDFPISELIANEELSLPIGPHINFDEIELICNKELPGLPIDDALKYGYFNLFQGIIPKYYSRDPNKSYEEN